jgi:glycerol-3-phosphate dehydrogenase
MKPHGAHIGLGRCRAELIARVGAVPCWDVVIVGGGATGLGCAVDAAARGYSTLLLEAGDFACGTSSRSTKLIHGGVRYLAQGNFALVREALLERARLLRNAPQVVTPLRFVVPAYRMHERLLLGAGLGLYDLLAGSSGMDRSHLLNRAQTLAALPTLSADGLRGAVAYWDAQFDDARLAVALAQTADALGGLVLNYCKVTGFALRSGRLSAVQFQDRDSGVEHEVAARVVINAAGVWADTLRLHAEPGAERRLRFSQGVHVVVDGGFLPGSDALLVPRTADGRVLFMIPWQGKVLLGTTDTVRADAPCEPEPLVGEVDFILSTAASYLQRPPTRADVRSVFVGLRPLLDAGSGLATQRLSREHKVDVSAQGLVSVMGGKWTTYRRMAEDAVDAAASVAGLARRSSPTADLRLSGDRPDLAEHAAVKQHAAEEAGSERLVDKLALTRAQVRHAVRGEFALSVEDVLARRCRALFLDAALARAAAPAVAAILADERSWSPTRERTECEAFVALAERYLARAQPGISDVLAHVQA